MRALAVFVGAFSGGIFLCQYLLPVSWQVPAALALFLMTAGIIRCFTGNTRRRILLAGLGICLALGWNWLYIRQVQRPMEDLAASSSGQRITLTLADYAQPTDYGAKVPVLLDGFFGKLMLYGQPYLLELSPGQSVETTVTLESTAAIHDEDVTTFTSKGIFLLAYEAGEGTTPLRITDGTSASVRWWPVRARHALMDRISRLFTGDTAALLCGILTGDKTALPAEIQSDLSEAGIYHILAVSGMHCGFLALFLEAVTFRRRRLSALVTIPALAFYALVTGGSPSVVRACIMLSFLRLAPLFRRENDPPTAMAAALGCILLQNPFAAASVSLQLSFGAVAGLLWLTPKLYQFLTGEKKRGKVYRYTAASFSATAGALVFTAPLSAWYFGFFALVSPLSNLLCLAAVGALFCIGLIAVLASFLFFPLGAAAAIPADLLSRYILFVCGLLSHLPYHALYTVNPYLGWWMAFLYLAFFLVRCRRGHGRQYAAAAVLCALTLGYTIKLGQLRYTGAAVDVLMLDAGQGACMLLESNGISALVDCGGNSFPDAGDLAADYLATMGCTSLDYLILTHYDADHVNGVETLLSRIDVKQVLVPDTGDDTLVRAQVRSTLEASRVPVSSIQQAETFSLGDGQITVYPPVGSGSDNEQGLAVLCESSSGRLLITGDMDAATERALLAQYTLPKIDVLAIGHHGAASSTSETLLKTLEPETALISVGEHNTYGHPDESVLLRLSHLGVAVCRTDKQGTIHVTLN